MVDKKSSYRDTQSMRYIITWDNRYNYINTELNLILLNNISKIIDEKCSDLIFDE